MKVRQLPSVACIPEHAGPGAALDILSARVHPKRRRAASHDARDGQIFAQQLAPQNFYWCKGGFTRGGALRHISLMKMPVVGVQAARLQRRQRSDEPVEIERVRVGGKAGAMLTNVEVDQDFEMLVRARAAASESAPTVIALSARQLKRTLGKLATRCSNKSVFGPTGW